MNIPAIPATKAGLPTRLLVAFVLFAVLAVLPPLLHAMGEPYLVSIVTRMIVYAIAVLSLDLILGYGAMVSFGHAAYLGIGAYAVVVLSRMGVTDLPIHLVAAMAAAALYAVITGAVSLRTTGVYFIMITLAFGQMAFFFFVSLSALGGDDGTALPARSTLLGMPWLEDDLVLFYVTLGFLIGVFALLYRMTGARFGRVLIGARDDEMRMQAVGFVPYRFKLAAYVISACVCSVAGVLLANQTEYVSPDFLNWHRSGELIVMLILGGIGNLTGAMVGALVTIGLEETLARLSEHWTLYFGIFLLLVVLYSPGGLSTLGKHLGFRENTK